MSDLLAATGWIGEHPMTGADVAHLLVHRATMLDSGGAAEIAAIARAWGLVDVTGLVEMPQTGLTVDLARHVLIAPGIEARFDGRAGWDRAARRQGFVVVTVTSVPLSAPSLDDIDAVVTNPRPQSVWSGFAGL